MIYYKFLRLESIYYFCEIDYVFKTEQWKDVVGFEGVYQVSDLGRVKRLEKTVNHLKKGRLLKEKMLKQKQHVYLKVILCDLSKSQTFTVQKLVSMSFLKHTPVSYSKIVNHINCIKYDNRLINLEIISQRENMSKLKTKRTGTSIYTGVHWCKIKKKWMASIWINNKKLRLGTFKTEIEAHNSYQNKLASLY